jgi:hypothetical protein
MNLPGLHWVDFTVTKGKRSGEYGIGSFVVLSRVVAVSFSSAKFLQGVIDLWR